MGINFQNQFCKKDVVIANINVEQIKIISSLLNPKTDQKCHKNEMPTQQKHFKWPRVILPSSPVVPVRGSTVPCHQCASILSLSLRPFVGVTVAGCVSVMRTADILCLGRHFLALTVLSPIPAPFHQVCLSLSLFLHPRHVVCEEAPEVQLG